MARQGKGIRRLAIVMILMLLVASAGNFPLVVYAEQGAPAEETSVSYAREQMAETVFREETLAIPASYRAIRPIHVKDKNIISVWIPRTVNRIGAYAFHDAALEDVYYEGTKEEWAKIAISNVGRGNQPLLDAHIHYESKSVKDIPHTSTDSPFAENYQHLLNGTNGWEQYTDLKNLLYAEDYYVIPGLTNTNQGNGRATLGMVPQGICVAGNYLLLSAYKYPAEKARYSVIYVLDKITHRYLTTLILNSKCHVGALACIGDTVFIADSTVREEGYRAWKLSLDQIDDCVGRQRDAVKTTVYDYITIDTNPDFLYCYDGNLLVGDFYNEGKGGSSFLKGYDPETGEQTVNKIYVGPPTQGGVVTEYKGKNYLIASSSFGRNNHSALTVRQLVKSRIFGWFLMPAALRHVRMPNMSEDIEIDGDSLLISFESGAARYQEQNYTNMQLDRVLNVSLRALIEGGSVGGLDENPLYASAVVWREAWHHAAFREVYVFPDMCLGLGLDEDDENDDGDKRDASNSGETGGVGGVGGTSPITVRARTSTGRNAARNPGSFSIAAR